MMQKGQTPILIIVGILVVVVIAGGAYYLGRTTNPKPSPTPVVTSQSPQPTPNASPTPTDAGETANWITYTNIKANYSFKYPTDWTQLYISFSGCSECIDGLDLSSSQKPNPPDSSIVIIQVWKEDRIKTLDDYVNIHVKGDASKINLQYTTLGGEKAVSYKLSGGIPPLPIIEYAAVKNGYQYILRIEDSKETNKNREKNIRIFNQILSTLKFL